MNHGLSAATVTKIHDVLSRHAEVEQAILYGSRAIGNFRPGSDIDLTLTGHGLNERILGQIIDELDDLLLPYKIDLSLNIRMIEHAGLRDHIQRVGKEFYRQQKIDPTLPVTPR